MSIDSGFAMSIEIGTGERGKFVFRNGKMVRYRKPKPKIVPEIISDEMPPTESMATPARQIFTSKKKYRQHLALHGFRETGGEHLKGPSVSSIREEEEREDRQRREDVVKAYFDIKYDRVQFTEAEKENHLREKRRCEALGLPTKVKAPY